MIAALLASVGLAVLCVGVWFIYWPAALVTAGLALIAVGLSLEVKE